MCGNKIDAAVMELAKLLIEYDLFVENISTSGKLQRCKVLGDGRNEKSGAYFLKPNYPYNYFLINFRQSTQLKGSFKNLKDHVSCIYRTALKPKVKPESLFSANEYLEKSNYATNLFNRANSDFTLLSSNDYLTRKRVLPLGIKFDSTDALIIPGCDQENKIWTFQRIFQDGSKRFLSKAKKFAVSHKIGFAGVTSSYSGEIFITEGYATGASVHMATSQPTLVAFDAGNLAPVGQVVRNKYPKARLVYCLDADYAGINFGLRAATLTQGLVVIPAIKDSLLEIKMNDFNDLDGVMGLYEVKNQIYQQLPYLKLILVSAYQILHNEILIDDIEPRLHQLIKCYITSYFLVDFVKKIRNLEANNQRAALSGLNSDYLPPAKAELAKVLANDYFYNKKDLAAHYLISDILFQINNFLIHTSAKKICEHDDINIRRAMISKINPKFHNELKQKIDNYWQLCHNH